MKSKTIFLLAVIAALVAGFFLGRYQGGRSVSKFVEHDIINKGAAVDAQHQVRVLTYLKEGKETYAFRILEQSLDSSLLELAYCADLPPEQRDDFAVQAIRVAREYRMRYPWTGSVPELKDKIEGVLSLVK
jgi:hypothetical protein